MIKNEQVFDKQKLIQKAALQVISEILGTEEGKLYFLLLTKNNRDIAKEFSYSKRYRILKNLYKKGVMAKTKLEGTDNFIYLLLPPSFLHNYDVDNIIIEYLENLYLKNMGEIIDSNFSQFILVDERSLVIFLLKHMKKNAIILGNESDFEDIINCNNIKFLSDINNRKAGIIDDRIVFEFTKILGENIFEYIGYISNKKDYIKEIKNIMK